MSGAHATSSTPHPITPPDPGVFLAAFHQSPAMQSVVRATDGLIVEVNDTFLKTFGFTRERIIGRSPLELKFWVDPEQQRAWKQELETRGFVSQYEVRMYGADGRILTVLLSTHPVDIGGVRHFVSAGVDISAHQEAEARLRESEARFRVLYEAVSAAVLVHDAQVVLQVNPAAVRMFGAATAADLLGKHPRHTSPPAQPDGSASPEAAARHIARALAEGTHSFEWTARTLAGRDFPVEVTLTPISFGGRPAMQAVVLDLTERKRAEAELQTALARERELGQLKSEFVSLVSHEFRTPLEIIMSSADILQRYHDRLAPEKRQELLQTVNQSVRQMSGMMEEVLVLGRLETDRMTFRRAPLDLPAFCRRLADEIGSATGQRCPVRLTLEAPGPAAGDESVLRHIFANLLANAVKYSPAGSPVDLAVTREGAEAVCRVADRGCGIPVPDRKRLFEAFHRGSNVRHIPGTGLGLLIVRRCVDLHGGRLAFESAEGQGTVFTVRLPLFT
ncbi:MAG: PAS domain S-box protein [Opitutaceae bacterium]|nr:PAS domain S-box protein [Opitutaceae bacterium]